MNISNAKDDVGNLRFTKMQCYNNFYTGINFNEPVKTFAQSDYIFFNEWILSEKNSINIFLYYKTGKFKIFMIQWKYRIFTSYIFLLKIIIF